MNVVLVCGSPRRKTGNSAFLLDALARKLEGRAEVELRHAVARPSEENERTAELAAASDALVVAFPLYVDGVPASLHEALERIGERVRAAGTSPRLYVVANNGFYDARQNALAVEMLWLWGDAHGLPRGRVVAVGAWALKEPRARLRPVGRRHCGRLRGRNAVRGTQLPPLPLPFERASYVAQAGEGQRPEAARPQAPGA